MTEQFTNKHTLGAGLVTAIYTWGYDFLVHGNLLKDLYDANKRLFRPEAQMMEMAHWCIAYHLIVAILVAGGYSWWRDRAKVNKADSVRASVGFGVWVGLLFAAPQLMAYMWLPLDTMELPQAWAIAELVKWAIGGVVLAKIYDWQNSR